MAKPTYPSVFFDDDASAYKCEMHDKNTGRTWGYGYGKTRKEAIASARRDQPKQGKIKKAVGWVTRHPFVAGAAIGTYITYRRARNHHADIRPIHYVNAAIVAGTIVWGISKIFKYIKNRFF